MTAESSVEARRDERWHLVDMAGMIWRWRYLFAGTFLIVVAAAVITVLVVTPSFTARASFMAAPGEGSGVSALLEDPLGAVLGTGAGGATLDRLVSILNSETVRRLVVDRFGLMRQYKVDTRTDAILALEKVSKVTVSPEGVIDISVSDRSPAQAAAMANMYVDLVDSLHREAQSAHAGQTRRFLETRVAENRRDLAKAEEAARVFAQESGVVSLPDQVAVLIGQIAEVEGQLQALDVEIGAKRQIHGPNHYSVRELEIERAQLVARKSRLIRSDGEVASDPLLSLSDVPDRVVEYARLQRDVETLALIQTLLIQQYEMAKLEEARNVEALTRLDRAEPPERRSWPRRTRIVVLSTAMGVLWGILLAHLADAWPRMRVRFASSIRRPTEQ